MQRSKQGVELNDFNDYNGNKGNQHGFDKLFCFDKIRKIQAKGNKQKEIEYAILPFHQVKGYIVGEIIFKGDNEIHKTFFGGKGLKFVITIGNRKINITFEKDYPN